MKILICYDGSPCALEAIHDLACAGLPTHAAAICASAGTTVEAAEMADAAAALVRLAFPSWSVRSQPLTGSPARALIELADEWRPGLLAAGSHGRTGLGRFLLGSVSHRLAAEARCSVRITRNCRNSGAPRVVVCTDGSEAAMAAVHEVASRNWPGKASFTVVSAHDTAKWPAEHEHPAMQVAEWQALRVARAGEAAEEAVRVLHNAGLAASAVTGPGPARKLILSQAKALDADCIFLGASGIEGHHPLGGTANAVLLHATCTVEIVRPGSQAAENR